MPAVSVILPTYNRAGFILGAVESVLQQTCSDLELIVVVDGSTDQTASLLQSLSDPRLVVIVQSNAGRSAARNNGLKAAQGKYIALLDDDDLFLPEKLAIQAGYLDSHPDVDLVGSGSRLIDAQGQPFGLLQPWQEQSNLDLLTCLYSCPLIPCGVIFRKSSLDRLDVWFDPVMPPSEDKDFFVRLIASGAKVAWVKELVASYRVHPNNSQQDGQVYLRVRNLMYDRIFTRPDLPHEVRAEKDRLYGYSYLTAACHCYATGQFAEAQQDLLQSLEVYPALAHERCRAVAAQMVDFSGTFHVRDSFAYLRGILSHLPPGWNTDSFSRRLLATYYAKGYFAAIQKPGRPVLGSLVRAIWYDPAWALNRGVWALFLKRLLL